MKRKITLFSLKALCSFQEKRECHDSEGLGKEFIVRRVVDLTSLSSILRITTLYSPHQAIRSAGRAFLNKLLRLHNWDSANNTEILSYSGNTSEVGAGDFSRLAVCYRKGL